jgi:DNA-directed RNA polymerase specialized sigma subunit
MPRQVTDEEYNFLQARRQVADFVESIYNDPTLNKEAKRLIKKKYPALQIPDYDIEEKVERRFDEEKRARDDAEAATRQKQTDERIASQRGQVQKEYGFTDEAMKRLEDLMVERNIGDYEAGAVYMASKEPTPIEPTFDNFRWNHDRQEGFKEIAADPEGWARKEILNAVRADERAAKGQR